MVYEFPSYFEYKVSLRGCLHPVMQYRQLLRDIEMLSEYDENDLNQVSTYAAMLDRVLKEFKEEHDVQDLINNEEEYTREAFLMSLSRANATSMLVYGYPDANAMRTMIVMDEEDVKYVASKAQEMVADTKRAMSPTPLGYHQ